jgi:hypothetical protein
MGLDRLPAGAANPKFARFRGKCVCELRVQSGTSTIGGDILVLGRTPAELMGDLLV